MNVIYAPAPAILPADDGRARKQAIARSFEEAAAAYDAHARVQRLVARRLARRVGALALPESPRILEIGCGTGFLARALLARVPGARMVCTDLSLAMTRQCRHKIGGCGSFAVMDGELAAIAPVFDLVVSSFAFQWFLDLRSALSGLAQTLRPGGRLTFATLGSESLKEWRELHRQAGIAYSGLDLPGAAALRKMALSTGRLQGTVAEEKVRLRYADAGAFLRELKSLGAGTPGPGAAARTADLRRLLRRAGRTGTNFPVTYHVLYGSFALAGAPAGRGGP